MEVRDEGYPPCPNTKIDRDEGYSPPPSSEIDGNEGYSPSPGLVSIFWDQNSLPLFSVLSYVRI
jgi:hypothetical protein